MAANDKRSTAVEFFIPDHPKTTRNLRGRLVEVLQIHIDQLANGLASDWGDYRHRVGKILAYKEALAQIDLIEKEMT